MRRRMTDSPSCSIDCSASQARAAGVFASVERGGDFGALRAVPHDLRVRAAAGGEEQCVHQDGFARAGFAGQHGEPCGDSSSAASMIAKVADLKMQQHGARQSCDRPAIRWAAATPRPQCSLERRIRK